MKTVRILTAALAAMMIAVGCTTPSNPQPDATQEAPTPGQAPATVIATSANPTPAMPLDPVDGVKRFQALAGLPDTQPKFSANTPMANSPSGTYSVMLYQDPDGRSFSIDPVTFTVVEYDARGLMPTFEALSVALPEKEQEAIAEKVVRAMIPDFDTLKTKLTYQGGAKGDIFFYDWRGTTAAGQSMPPFVQVAVHRSGQILGYINTLGLAY